MRIVVHDPSAKQLFPDIRLLGYQEALRLALGKLDSGEVVTAWSDSLASSRGDATPVQLATREGVVMEQRQLAVDTTSERVFASFTSLGGSTGWLYMNWAWTLRGAFDRILGGVGLRRGRRHPTQLRPGDALDFWRVEAIESPTLLRLRAEMKVPGNAWLEFRVDATDDGKSLFRQTAFFVPRGLLGWTYWYALYPIHGPIFSSMINKLAGQAEATADQQSDSSYPKGHHFG